MSADEIRRLANELRPKEGCYSCEIKTLSSVHTALLAYADMVERCEEKIAEYKSYVDVGIVAENISDLNYILKGETDERKV